MAGLFDGFIDQYMFDEMGADWVEGDIPESLLDSGTAAEAAPTGAGSIMEPRTISMEGPMEPAKYDQSAGAMDADMFGPMMGPQGAQVQQQIPINQLSAEESMLPKFNDRPEMDINQISENAGPVLPGQSGLGRAQGNTPGSLEDLDPRPKRPEDPSYVQRQLNPNGHKREMAAYQADDKAWVERQQKKRLAAYASQSDDPEFRKAILSGVPEVQEAAIKRKFAADKQQRAQTAIEFYKEDPAAYAAMQRSKPAQVEFHTDNKLRNIDSQIALDDGLATAKDARTYVSGIIDKDRESGGTRSKNNRILQLLKSGENTGFAADWIMKSKQALRAAGLPFDVGSGEELQTLLGDKVMERVAQTKGAVSEREMKLFQEYSANYGKSIEGNEAIINFQNEVMDRNKDMARMALKMRRAKVPNIEIEQRLLEYRDENPIDIGMPVKTEKEVTPDSMPKGLKGKLTIPEGWKDNGDGTYLAPNGKSYAPPKRGS